MRRYIWICALATACAAQQSSPEPELGFEGIQKTTGVRGWFEQPSGIAFADSEIVHSGKYSARIEGKPPGTSLIMRLFPIDFDGEMLEMRAYVRTADLTGGFQLWVREDGQLRPIGNAMSQPVRGTTDWSLQTVKLPLHAAGQQVYYGIYLYGTGRAWLDDIQFFVDGKPMSEVKKGRGIDDSLKLVPTN